MRLPVMTGGGFDWVDVRDIAAAALRAEEAAPAGARYLLSGRWVSNGELAVMVAEIAGVRPPRLFIPLGLACLVAPLVPARARTAGREALFTTVALRDLRGNRCISHARAADDLGYAPRPLRETLADTWNGLRAWGA